MLLMCRNIFIFQTIICAFSILLYEILTWKASTLNFTSLFTKSNHTDNFYSSVSCHGYNHSSRVCYFKNLWYNPFIDKFVFLHSPASILSGVPENRFNPALTDFSSVHNHNTQYFNYIDLPHSALSSLDVELVSGLSLIFKRFNPENLMHVFHDDLIPAFATLNEVFMLRENVQFVFADGRKPGPYSNLYEKFLDRKPLYLNSSLTKALCFEAAIVGLNKDSLWYQYGFTEPQGQLNKDLSTVFSHIISFRKYFLDRFSIADVASNAESAILFIRKSNRKILNYHDVAELIKKKLNLNAIIMSLENFSVIDIIKEIISSKMLVGVHGSLLILSLFLSSHSHLIELFPYAVNPNISTPYRTLASIPGLELNYQAWENRIKENSFPHPEYPPELGGILHLPRAEQESITKSIVKPFLCCYNPEWLYRIYQDTLVDLDSFSVALDEALKRNQEKNTSVDILARIYPSEVQNISCTVSFLNTIHITWESPWNVHFLNDTILEYELWYQNGDEEVKAYIMKKNHVIFREEVLKSIYVWIRCHMNNKTGPFNTNPVICH